MVSTWSAVLVFGVAPVLVGGGIPGDQCSSPVRLDCNGIVEGSNVGAANDLDDEPEEFCLWFGGSGPDVFYEMRVPGEQTAEAWVTPLGSWDPALWIVTDCRDRLTCLVGVDAGTIGDTEQLVWTNESPDAVTVFLVVDSWTASSSGVFVLETRCQSPLAAQGLSWGSTKARFDR